MDKSTELKPEHRRGSLSGGIAQRSGSAAIRPQTDFQGFKGCETVLQERFDRQQLCVRWPDQPEQENFKERRNNICGA